MEVVPLQMWQAVGSALSQQTKQVAVTVSPKQLAEVLYSGRGPVGTVDETLAALREFCREFAVEARYVMDFDEPAGGVFLFRANGQPDAAKRETSTQKSKRGWTPERRAQFAATIRRRNAPVEAKTKAPVVVLEKPKSSYWTPERRAAQARKVRAIWKRRRAS